MKTKTKTLKLPALRAKALLCAMPVLLSGLVLHVVFRLASPPALDIMPTGTVLLDRHGLPLRIALAENEIDSRPIEYASISPWVVKALIAAEDKRFRQHPGIDPFAISRAWAQNMVHRRRISGASTLSTQVVRLSEPRPRTWTTKLIEGFKALNMERGNDKQSILEQYLNRAPFGGILTGVESAARVYFDKSAADLTLAEAAVLAGLPQAPSRLRPDRHPAAARRRMRYVLDRMSALGFITPEQKIAALEQPLDAGPAPRPFRAPHFCDLVLQRHRSRNGTLRTTLDSPMQHTVEAMVARHFLDLSRKHITDAAVVVLDVETGAVRAMLGSPDYFNRRHNGMYNSALAARSPGSALKPFIYALALDQGTLTPGTMLEDSPMRLRDTNPRNFDNIFRGAVTVRDALILSLNIPALRVTGKNGLRETIDLLRELGLRSLTRPAAEYGLGIALGGGEVCLLDLVNAYACLARLGIYRPYRLTEDDDSGEAAFRVFSPEAAFMVADILGGQERSLDLFGHRADADLPRMAWKTGTSSGFRDAWTIAWNPRYVVGVWLGNHDGAGSPALVGARSAAPLAGDIFRAIGREPGLWYTPPAGLRERQSAGGGSEWYIPGISMAAQATGHTVEDIQIAYPVNGSAFVLTPARHLDQTIALRAEGVPAHTPLYWFANGRYLGQAMRDTPLYWPLQTGEWQLTCVTPAGARATTTVGVH